MAAKAGHLLCTTSIALLLLRACSSGPENAAEAVNAEAELDTAEMEPTAGRNGVGDAPFENPPPPPPPPQEAVAYCPRIQENMPVARCEEIERAWNNLEQGRGAIAYPNAMERDETATVTLVLGRPGDASSAIDSTIKDLLGAEPDQKFKVRVARRMAARLQGDGFNIEPEGLIVKDLYLGEGQSWDWKVTAQKNPRYLLRLSTYAVVVSPNGFKENLLKTVQIDVPVRVTWQQKLGDITGNLSIVQALVAGLAALLTALLGVWVAVRKFRSA